MEPPAAAAAPDPTPQDQSSASASPAKRSAWKHPAPNGPAVMDASNWPALSDAAKATTKLAPDSASPAAPVASSAVANSSNSQKRHKPARRAAAAGDHSPRDHPDRNNAAAAAWDHAGARGGRSSHNNNGGGGRRGNAPTTSAAGVAHHGSFGARRRGAYDPPFYRGPPPPMGMGPYMRGAPPMTVAPPFMGGPPPPVSPMRPFAGPMVFHDMASPVSPVSPIYFYGPPPPPEALRGLPLAPPMLGPPAYPYFQAPPEPQPDPEPQPQPDGQDERAKLLKQIEFYFSKENLCSDVYLRQQMDGQGWVDISLIAGFNKVQELKKDLQYIKETVQSSSILEMKDDKIRKHSDWEKWVIPRESNPDVESSSASVPSRNVNNLTAHLGGMGLHESARSTGTVEQKYHCVVQNGSPSGNEKAPVAEDSSGHQ